MPRLFQLDDYEECFSSKRGAFCLGSFDLLEHSNQRLLQQVQDFSKDKYHFNHTHIHRGLCITTHCAHIEAPTLRSRFEQCVGNITSTNYGLQTNLTHLEYCKTAKQGGRRPVDRLDMWFAWICGAIVLINIIGTAYDVFKSSESKPNKFLMTWSLCVNWRRLTADYSDGDPRLSALKPVQGMKALTMLLIMMAHSVLAHHITYIYNPLFFEKASHKPMSAYFQNGTSIVQTFIMASSFLLAYNLLLHSENSKRPLSLGMFPKSLLHRITRISPVYLFVLGMAVTWWYHVADGPLWDPLVGGECDRCRDKWWTQALFINNLVRPDVRYMRTQFKDEASFTWLYQAPWDSLPSALIGLFVAFLHHQLQSQGYKPGDSLVIRILYRVNVPCMFFWVFAGYFMKDVSSPAWVALYAALDRPVFMSLTAFAMYGFFNKIDSLWWRFLSWRGWEVLGRMSLSIYLVHWLHALTVLAVRPQPSPVSVYDIGGHFLWTVFVSYPSAVLLHLFVELPAQKFLQAIF
ncbi:Uncharacterized protein OBRU01_08986, partial [Operophtera brumata]